MLLSIYKKIDVDQCLFFFFFIYISSISLLSELSFWLRLFAINMSCGSAGIDAIVSDQRQTFNYQTKKQEPIITKMMIIIPTEDDQ